MPNFDIRSANRLKQAKRNKPPGLYRSPEGMVCFGHYRGFDPSSTKPIVEGCVSCMKKVNK